MVHLPKQSNDIGLLIYNLARLQRHYNEMSDVPRQFPGMSDLVQQLRLKRRKLILPAD